MTLNQGVPTVNTFNDTAPPIGYVGGFVTGEVRIGHIFQARVHIHREFWFARDNVGGEWSAFVALPERDSGSDDTVGVGSILITDSTVNAFMEQLVQLIADPEAVGDATFGPKPTPRALDAA